MHRNRHFSSFQGVFADSFQISPSNVTGLNGASLTLSCHANSVPADIQWTVDDIFVRSTSSIATTYSAGDATIEFSPLGYGNEGVYRCVAVNGTGQELFRSHPGRVDVLGEFTVCEHLFSCFFPALYDFRTSHQISLF